MKGGGGGTSSVAYLINETLNNGDCSSSRGMKGKYNVIYLNWIQPCWISAQILVLIKK
jgi:hypothetical protein